jgi:tRNA G10  N-methylase Trm11
MNKNLILLMTLSCCHALTFLCKTKETFKLAELQWLEAKLQAETSAQAYTVTKLLVDRATGSTLFRLDFLHDGSFWCATSPHEIPSSLKRCDWIAQVLNGEGSAEALIRQLQEDAPHNVQDNWNISYIRMEESEKSTKRRHPSHTKNTLLHSVAQSLPCPPALNPNDANQQLLVLDTRKKDDRSCYLTNIIQHSANCISVKSALAKWSKRPFQYSSAINPQVAELVMDILSGLTDTVNHDNGDQTLTLLDPTCGSGTFLALAIDKGMQVEAYDCNPQCVHGTRRNLEFLFPKDQRKTTLKNTSLSVHDSANPFPSEKSNDHSIDCVVANLPWGINSKDLLDQNQRILRSVRSRIEPGTPCAFVTRESDLDLFNNTGYRVLGQAHVPQRDFSLPKGTKKQHANELGRNGRNQCVVTIARAI